MSMLLLIINTKYLIIFIFQGTGGIAPCMLPAAI